MTRDTEYHILARQNHPDKHHDDDASRERTMHKINSAYAVLSDPALRRKYDEYLKSELQVARVCSRSECLTLNRFHGKHSNGYVNQMHLRLTLVLP
jgi:DnaJ-class molecular chaperone